MGIHALFTENPGRRERANDYLRVRRNGDAAVKATKVFNNNAVSTVMPDGREAIVLGKGIGFHKRPGETVDERLVEKIYYVQNEMQTKFLQMLQDVRPEVMEAAERIIAAAEAEGFYMSNQATISLVDHISFSIERQEKQIALPNLLLSETQMLYQREYELGCRSLQIIRDCCGVDLPEDEAGYIALHLVSISVDHNAAYGVLKFVNGALGIIKETYGITLDQGSLDAMRLTTHLKFLAQRIQQNTAWGDDGDEPMYRCLLARDPRHQACIDRLEAYTRQNFSYTLSQQEKFYLLIHLTKILQLGE